MFFFITLRNQGLQCPSTPGMVVLFGVIGNNHDYDDDDGDDDQLVIILVTVTVTVTVTIMVMAVTVTVTSTPSCSCCSSSFSISICNNVYNQTFLSELKKQQHIYGIWLREVPLAWQDSQQWQQINIFMNSFTWTSSPLYCSILSRKSFTITFIQSLTNILFKEKWFKNQTWRVLML